MAHLFGPVPSRRLGLSLGIDLVPYKVCSFDCIYCEVGATTLKTMERKEYVPLEEVMEELEGFLCSEGSADFITFSGFGEPTLHSRIGELMDWIRGRTKIPMAVLTNSSLLWDPNVRRELARAHVVLPSLDAGSQEVFERINRPHSALKLERIVEGLKIFSREFDGEIWLEILLVKGVNDSSEELERLASLVREISPHRVQLNTVVRPPAGDAGPLNWEEMEALLPYFGDRAEVVAFSTKKRSRAFGDLGNRIVETVSRRPCTRRDIAKMLGVSELEVIKHIDTLLSEHKIKIKRHEGNIFYLVGEGE